MHVFWISQIYKIRWLELHEFQISKRLWTEPRRNSPHCALTAIHDYCYFQLEMTLEESAQHSLTGIVCAQIICNHTGQRRADFCFFSQALNPSKCWQIVLLVFLINLYLRAGKNRYYKPHYKDANEIKRQREGRNKFCAEGIQIFLGKRKQHIYSCVLV